MTLLACRFRRKTASRWETKRKRAEYFASLEEGEENDDEPGEIEETRLSVSERGQNTMKLITSTIDSEGNSTHCYECSSASLPLVKMEEDGVVLCHECLSKAAAMLGLTPPRTASELREQEGNRATLRKQYNKLVEATDEIAKLKEPSCSCQQSFTRRTPMLTNTDLCLTAYGFAVGGYHRICTSCRDPFSGDKQAWMCRECAAKMKVKAEEILPEPETVPLTKTQVANKVRRILDKDRYSFGIPTAVLAQKICDELYRPGT